MRFAGKVAIVTGGARGIGFALAKRLCGEEAAVVIADIDEDAGINAAQRLSALGGRAIAVTCDVADDRSMDNAVAKAVGEFGKLDILLANAGLHLSGYTKPP
jgi:NAD(P)-dependent dehydrogenase (short-subunit alcohol dehydrogenase family)